VLATFVVNTLSDTPLSQSVGDGFLSLREALEAANTNQSVDGSPAGEADDFFNRIDKITFSPGLTGTIVLRAGELFVYSNVDILGPGATKLVIDADHKSRVLNVSGSNTQFGSLHLFDCTLINGNAMLANSDGLGGAIKSAGSTVLTRVTISGSYAELDGGAIYSKSTTAWNSSIINNTAGRNGGAFYTWGWDQLFNSTVANNTAVRGGGIYSKLAAGSFMIRSHVPAIQ
jgi:predicted outer membrane repeat protein